MNNGEANDVNTFFRWFLNADHAADASKAEEAAGRLAGRAYKALMCGLTGDNIQQQWPSQPPQEAVERLEALLADDSELASWLCGHGLGHGAGPVAVLAALHKYLTSGGDR